MIGRYHRKIYGKKKPRRNERLIRSDGAINNFLL
jgi:hypothetical protein